MKIELTNSAKKLCVIGDPVLHSKSPLIQNTLCQTLGLDYLYLCQTVRREELGDFLAGAKALGYAGFNATMPFKEDLIPYMDRLDPLAEKLGAVNTVCIREGKLLGCNTDCPGLPAALEGEGRPVRGKRVVVLGAGGAARAAALGLAQSGAASVTVANRTLSKAEEAAGLAPEVITPIPLTPGALRGPLEKADILVNATNLGMAGSPPWPELEFLTHLPPGALVCDLIYHPAETELLARAKALGHPVMNGIPLLIHQAILALERFAQVTVPVEKVLPVVRRALADGE